MNLMIFTLLFTGVLFGASPQSLISCGFAVTEKVSISHRLTPSEIRKSFCPDSKKQNFLQKNLENNGLLPKLKFPIFFSQNQKAKFFANIFKNNLFYEKTEKQTFFCQNSKINSLPHELKNLRFYFQNQKNNSLLCELKIQSNFSISKFPTWVLGKK